jgi:membrane dipeptidase
MEHADSIRTRAEVGFRHAQGLRISGPAWHSKRFTGSARDGGPLTAHGRKLLAAPSRLGMALDRSHMSEEACLEALATYAAAIMASLANLQCLLPLSRLLSERVLTEVARRDGVLGVIPVHWALVANWRQQARETIPVDRVAEAIDGVCQIVGDARHVELGTDFDGGQGAECTPRGLRRLVGVHGR